jgi:hypothetical protein
MSVPLPGPSSQPSLHTDHLPAIAVSYGVIARPVPAEATRLAHEAAVEVCERLWNDWGLEQSGDKKRKVQLYTVNIPLKEDVLVKESRRICWTTMWRNYYGQLFKPTKEYVLLSSSELIAVNRRLLKQMTTGIRIGSRSTSLHPERLPRHRPHQQLGLARYRQSLHPQPHQNPPASSNSNSHLPWVRF